MRDDDDDAERPGRRSNDVDFRLGARLRQLRRLRRLSQTELGERIGVTYQQVQKYERGQNRLPARLLPRLVRVLGVHSDLLLAGLPDGEAGEGAEPPLLDEAEMAQLLSAFSTMRGADSRRRLLAIVRAFAEEAERTAHPDRAACGVPHAAERGW
ncbi:helix-turn-helix domain-containing protein [Falsiroseomonas sp. CW058]|uniref:helix-turn-helix domain-containing protein n=1 Tax=Falsiroseomonas sp. CW058 TaxID=3388664 RepID=UPI003D3168FB